MMPIDTLGTVGAKKTIGVRRLNTIRAVSPPIPDLALTIERPLQNGRSDDDGTGDADEVS